jgi:hypothetical protein
MRFLAISLVTFKYTDTVHYDMYIDPARAGSMSPHFPYSAQGRPFSYSAEAAPSSTQPQTFPHRPCIPAQPLLVSCA